MSFYLRVTLISVSLFIIQSCGGGSGSSSGDVIPSTINVEIQGLRPVGAGGNQLIIQLPNETEVIIAENQTLTHNNSGASSGEVKILTHPDGQACMVVNYQEGGTQDTTVVCWHQTY